MFDFYWSKQKALTQELKSKDRGKGREGKKHAVCSLLSFSKQAKSFRLCSPFPALPHFTLCILQMYNYLFNLELMWSLHLDRRPHSMHNR